MSVFVHASGIKTVHAGGWGQKWQNSVDVVVECPLKQQKNRVSRYFTILFFPLRVRERP